MVGNISDPSSKIGQLYSTQNIHFGNFARPLSCWVFLVQSMSSQPGQKLYIHSIIHIYVIMDGKGLLVDRKDHDTHLDHTVACRTQWTDPDSPASI